MQVLQYDDSTYESNVAFALCNFQDTKKSRSIPIILSLLQQICVKEPGTPPAVEAYYDKYQNRERLYDWDELSTVFLETVIRGGQKIIAIDGLDECIDLDRICPLLKKLAGMSASNVKIIITSRFGNADIRTALDEFDELFIDSTMVQDDIHTYVSGMVKSMLRRVNLSDEDSGLMDEMIQTLVEKADGM
jgi:hypothetical protein